MAEKRDYYEVLGVARDADAATIKTAFRTLALKYHPDRNKAADAKERFEEIAEAYAVLRDPKKRADYDSGGHPGVSGLSAEDLFGGIDFDDILSGLGFGIGRANSPFENLFARRSGPRRGQNIEVKLTVSLERIAKGGEETVRVRHPAVCGDCKGSGAKAGTAPKQCKACGGSGNLVRSEKRGNVTYQQVTTCGDCGGQGKIIEQPCVACSGTGETFRDEKIKVKVPIGFEDGMALRVAGHGLPPPPGGEGTGDLLVVIRTERDPRFLRRGADLWRDETVSVTDAVLGTNIRVPTMDGEVSVRIPPGTQAGETLRLAGKGLPRFQGETNGDLLVNLRVHIPEKLSKAERKLYEQISHLKAKQTDSNKS